MNKKDVHISPELEQRLLEGDEAAMKCVFTMYYARLHYFSFQTIGNYEEAKDIVADTFLAFWTNIQDKKVAPGNMGGYLYRIVRNRCSNYLDRQQMLAGKNDQIIDEFYERARQRMDDVAVQAELFNQLKGLFNQLTPIQSSVMELIFSEGLGIQDVADRLKTTANNVRNHKARALERLKSIIKDTIFSVLLFFSCFF